MAIPFSSFVKATPYVLNIKKPVLINGNMVSTNPRLYIKSQNRWACLS